MINTKLTTPNLRKKKSENSILDSILGFFPTTVLIKNFPNSQTIELIKHVAIIQFKFKSIVLS